MKTTQPIRNPQDVNRFLNYFKKQGHYRNYVLAILGIHTALRISDILNLSWSDVYDFKKKKIRQSITIVEKKSKKSKSIALNKAIESALKLYLPEAAPNKPLIINQQTDKAISRIQAYRIIREAAEAINLDGNISCHSLRKTFGYHAWQNGVSPAVIMNIYNHSSMAITQRYLGVAQDDLNAVYIGMNFQNFRHKV